MGFLKSGSFAVLCVLLFLSLLTLNSFLTLSLSLSHDNIQKELSFLVRGLAGGTPEIAEKFDRSNFSSFDVNKIIGEDFQKMQLHCEEYKDYIFLFEGQTIVMPCSYIKNGEESVVNKTVSDFVDAVYYEEYNCGFWKCVVDEKVPFFLVSKKAQDYWNGKFYFFLVVVLVLASLLFFTTENKANFPIVLGGTVVLSAFSFSKIYLLFHRLFSIDSLEIFSLFFNVLFSKSSFVSAILSVIGFILIGVGLFFRIRDSRLVKGRSSDEEDSKAGNGESETREKSSESGKRKKQGNNKKTKS